jgi:hypothetical protein
LRTRFATLVVAGGLLLGLFPMAGTALAATGITPANASISADTGPAPTGTALWTALSGPVATDGALNDIPNSGTVTLTLTGSFELRTAALGGAVGAAFSASAGACALTASAPVVTATTITTELGGTAGTGSDRCRLTFSGIQVRPTTGVTPNTGTLALSGAISGAAGTLTMVPGAPILTFTQQPSTPTAAGIAFTTQPQVTSKDRFANPRDNDDVVLAIRAGTGTAGAVLECTATTVNTDPAGVAAFAGCKIRKAGTGYQLRATTASATPVDSNAIQIDVGSAAKLGFVNQPARGVPGVSFAGQPQVAVQDAEGNTVTTFSQTPGITLTIKSGTGSTGAVLACSDNPRQVNAGIAFFSGCRIDRVGVGFRLTASLTGYASAESNLFDVADRLAFTVNPSGAVGGVAFTTQPQVSVRAGASATAVNDNGTVVTLAIQSGTGATGAVLTCTNGLSRTVVAGVAAFSGCSIDKSSPTNNQYRLIATATSLSSAESQSFAVVPGPASKVLFTVQPAAVNVGVVFAAAPAVSITDAGGNVITTGTDSTRVVSLSIGTNPGGGTLTCTGGVSKAAVAGVATFTGCSIDRAGVGYTLIATSSGLTSATSNAFNVTAPAAVMTLLRSTGMLTYGQVAGLTVQFAANGAYRAVYLEYTYAGFPWTTVASTTTSSTGFASATYRPARSGYYRIRFDGAPDLSAAYSNVVLIGVRQTITLNPTHSGTMTIAKGREITFRGTVNPLPPTGVAARVTFRFYQKQSGTWVLKYERHVATDTSGVSRTTFRFGVGGNWYVMAFADTTKVNAVSRYSQREYFYVQ